MAGWATAASSHPARRSPLLMTIVGLLLGACGEKPATPAPFVAPTAAQVAQHNAALGEMGRFEFDRAVPLLDALLAEAPGWHDARVNLALALLNTQEEALLDRATHEVGVVLAAEPAHVRGRYALGLLRLYRGDASQALPLFTAVAQADPADAATHYWVGFCHETLEHYEQALGWYRQAVALDGYVQNAWYGAFKALQALDRPEEARPYFEEYERLETNPLARSVQFKYSRMGGKGMAQPGDLRAPAEVQARPLGRYVDGSSPPSALRVEGRRVRWATQPGPITQVDLDGDGHQDLLLVAGEDDGASTHMVWLRGQEGGGFRVQASEPFELVQGVRAALAGDLNNDGRVDLVLCRQGPERAFLQGVGGRFEDVTTPAHLDGDLFDSVDGLLADLDHDGDLDVYLVNRDGPNVWLSNNLDGTFRTMGTQMGLAGDGRPSTCAIPADLDGDRDLDLVLLHAQPPHEVFWNERLWAWKREPRGLAPFLSQPAMRGVAADADGDGVPELYVVDGATLTRWAGPASGGDWTRTPLGLREEPVPRPGSPTLKSLSPDHVAVGDLDGDGRLDLVVGAHGGWGVVPLVQGRALAGAGAAGVQTSVEEPPVGHWLLLATLDPGTGPVVVRTRAGQAPEVHAAPRAAYRHVGLTFSGKHKDSDSMRSNASGLGLRAVLQVGSTGSVRHHLRSASGPGQSLAPLFAGLGAAPEVDYLTLLWPDGLLQTEVRLAAGRVHAIEEVQRQTSSCPVLFCWDGQRHAFVTDLLGVGGLGFWVAPETYAPALPREHLLLPEGLPVARAGRYVLKLGEPMEETCYLDHADLVAWDLPPGVSLVLDERMGVLGAAPTSVPKFLRRERVPVRASDERSRDVTEAVRTADRRAAPVGPLDARFLGRTLGSALTLEFDADVDAGPGEALLVADGWIEYPYASTLFAAWQAGAEYRAPTLEARGADGVWVVVAEQFGYPAGMPRTMAFPLPPLPKGTRALRLSGTYEVYWDRVCVAWAEPCPEARRRVLPRAKAELHAPGFARRTTGPQRLPHYDWERRTPLWDCRHQRGLFTRWGDVEPLLAATDDALVVFGPGEEVHLEYAADLPPTPPGFTRRFVLESTGWCKDMDLATKDGDTVGPLPVREGAPASRARDALHAATLTRRAGAGR